MLGDRLEALAAAAEREAVLIAPFIKQEALGKVMRRLKPGLRLTCVTRWRIDEIAGGSSDLQVWPMLRARMGALLLRGDLHAKAYIFDDKCLLGSANLTNSGLGWSARPNLEVLVELPRSCPEVASLEAEVSTLSTEVDEALFEAMVRAVAALPPEDSLRNEPEREPNTAWIPRSRSPEFLYPFYSGEQTQLTAATRSAAADDLQVLKIRTGLSLPTFNATIAVYLLQSSVFAELDHFLLEPRRFGEVSTFLGSRIGPDKDAAAAWQVLMRWLRHFIPDRYVLSVPNYSEIMTRRDAIERAQRTHPR